MEILTKIFDQAIDNKKKSSKKIYVGNISYNASEEQLIEVLKIVGPVVSFKFNLNKETGQQKGYGFCLYADHESASSAIRNLNGFKFQGRNLKIHFPDKNEDQQQEMDQHINKDKQIFDPVDFKKKSQNKNIYEVLKSLDTKQKYFIMSEIKNVIAENPEQYIQMLATNSKLSSVLLDMQYELGMVNKLNQDQRNLKLIQPPQLVKKIKQ